MKAGKLVSFIKNQGKVSARIANAVQTIRFFGVKTEFFLLCSRYALF